MGGWPDIAERICALAGVEFTPDAARIAAAAFVVFDLKEKARHAADIEQIDNDMRALCKSMKIDRAEAVRVAAALPYIRCVG